MMKRGYGLAFFFAVLLSCMAHASSEPAPAAGMFDRDGDGSLSELELEAFLAQATEMSLSEFNLDLDDALSDDEVLAIKREFTRRRLEARRIAEEYSRQPRLPAQRPGWGVLVRGSHLDVDLTNAQFGRKSATSANFSMTEDLASRSRVMGIKGALLRPFALGAEMQRWLVPGVELNRLSNQTQPDREIDSVTFRLGSDFYFESERIRGGSLQLRVNPLVTTNFGFDVDVRAIEIQLEPDLDFHAKLGPLEYDFRVLVQSEYGQVVDAGKRRDLQEGDSFSRLGFKLDSRFRPGNSALLEGLEGILSYEHFEDLSGDLRARQLLRMGLAYEVDLVANLTLETSYTRGDTSVALEDEETWTIGLGFKL